MLTKQERFLGRGPQAKSSRVRTQENRFVTWLPVSGSMVIGLASRLSLTNHFHSRVLPGGTRIAQRRWMAARRILGGGQTHGVSFGLFLNSTSWW